jgi:hypothetical protein
MQRLFHKAKENRMVLFLIEFSNVSNCSFDRMMMMMMMMCDGGLARRGGYRIIM